MGDTSIAVRAKRYFAWKAWARQQKSEGFKGLLMPYDHAQEDAIKLASVLDHIIRADDPCEELCGLIAAMESLPDGKELVKW